MHIIPASNRLDPTQLPTHEPFPEKTHAASVLPGALTVHPVSDIHFRHPGKEAGQKLQMHTFVLNRKGQCAARAPSGRMFAV